MINKRGIFKSLYCRYELHFFNTFLNKKIDPDKESELRMTLKVLIVNLPHLALKAH